MRIVFLCSEYEGLLKTGGLADATRGLALAFHKLGHDVEVVMPRYANLYNVPVQAEWQSLYFQLGYQSYGCAIRHLDVDGIKVSLVEHHEFFQRPRPYDDGYHAYGDNSQRFAVFCKAALLYLQQQETAIDVIHGHDWQSALAACYLKGMKSGALTQSKFVLTIHNAAYQQGINRQHLSLLDLHHWHLPSEIPLTHLALGVWQADAVNTVSPGYRDELLSEPAANGLAPLYQARAEQFVGILNGCDYSKWDPSTDLSLPASFSVTDLSGKARCKTELRRQYQLADLKVPLIVSVSRVTAQKGFDYLIPALNQWLGQGKAQVLLMGTGEVQYIDGLKQLQTRYPENYRFIEGFDESLSHQVEAAGDFFLMPSLFEPCGLNQIYSLKYGTVPIVRSTGGLKDTVVPLQAKNSTGIRFEDASVSALLAALDEAVALFSDQRKYKTVQKRGMNQVFDWQRAALQYVDLFQ
ncbi:MAG TPA: glycogen synthase [Rheinheimera sp.]|nr:glycogen synthase [Rheinheimera sp.]